MIRVEGLTKRFGTVTAVHDLSFEVGAGAVTGFIGPNGAGKSTTMRIILGLDRPTAGRALVNGTEYARLRRPTAVVGAVLDPNAMHRGRTARAHLRWAATAAGVPGARSDEVLEQVGLARASSRRIGALSLGMRQRLAIGVALLGRPSVLILDEPLNGLDPGGIVWMRGVLTDIAAEGGTVLISSHLMNEMQETADHVVLIAAGRLVASLGMEELITRASGVVRVAGEDLGLLPARLTREGATVSLAPDGRLDVSGIDSRAIGRIALELGVVLDELSPERGGLEQRFLDLTSTLERVA
ncbi:MAG TPA: ATP-binding cassette domain-containing protein [Propionibacteriaceae bacterium]|nr:ATP-binding cassette domain-containing protein [Propionibacteriaceae bacterium]